MKTTIIPILTLLTACSVQAQTAYRVDPPPVMTTSGTVPAGGFPALYAVAGATVNLYTSATLTTLATTYTSTAASPACPTYAQVTVGVSATCISTTGTLGNFGWWLLPGNYFYTVTYGGVTYGPFPITTSTPGTGSGTVTTSGSPVSGNIAAFTGATVIGPGTAANVVNLFTGCSGTDYLGADGACHAATSALACSATQLASNVCLNMGSDYIVSGTNLYNTYLNSAAGAVQTKLDNKLTTYGVTPEDFGAVGDGAISSSGVYSGTDDCTSLTNFFNSLGTDTALGTNSVGLLNAGIYLTSCVVGIGQGNSTTISPINGITVIGTGGYQTLESAGGPTFGASGSIPSRKIKCGPGTSCIAYIGTQLSANPVFTVNGPIHDVHLQGFTIDANFLSQTGIYITQFSGSTVKDVFVLNNGPYTNPWNCGWWVSAYQGQFDGTESGTQFNTFQNWGTIADTASCLRCSVAIGCPDISSCPGTGPDAENDVSGNVFINTVMLDYTGMSKGLVMGYMDGDLFNLTNTAAYTGIYILQDSYAFPADIWFIGGSPGVGTAYVPSWVTTASIAANCNTPCAVTTSYGSPSSDLTQLPSQPFVQIDDEIMQVTNISGGTITVTRALGGTVQEAHSSGAGVLGPFGYMIDGNGPCTSGYILLNQLYFNPLITDSGYPPNSLVETQISPNGNCGIIGVTQSGFKFNGVNTGPFNPLLAAQVSTSGPTISDTSAFKFFGANVASKWAQTVSTGLVSSQHNTGTVLHFKALINVANSTGSAATVFGGLNMTDVNGTRAFLDANGLSIPGGSANSSQIQAEGTITIAYTSGANPGAANVTVDGKWYYSTTVISTGVSTHSEFPMLLTSTYKNTFGPDYLNDGLGLDFGVNFGTAATGISATLAAFDLWGDQASLSTIF